MLIAASAKNDLSWFLYTINLLNITSLNFQPANGNAWSTYISVFHHYDIDL